MKQLLNLEIQRFIRENENSDIAGLALQKPPQEGWPYRAILDQIKARQKAAKKLPLWSGVEGLIFPPADIIEQASSAATARYKACLVQGETVIDLTAGAGVDSCAFTEHFSHVTSVERERALSSIVSHNAPLLLNASSEHEWEVVNMAAETFLETAPPADLIYIDPQRREESRKGLYRFSDCSPDVTALLPRLKEIAPRVMVKASPMLDITKGREELDSVSAIHAVEWDGQCKEVLYILDFENQTAPGAIPVTAASVDDEGGVVSSFTHTPHQEEEASIEYGAPLRYLYEPGPAFLKAGGHKTLGASYNLLKLHPHTHLYTSDALNNDFPGRRFEIIDSYPARGKKIPLRSANLTVRNFPAKAPELIKKLGLKDGGEDYLFACTVLSPGDEKTILHGRKI